VGGGRCTNTPPPSSSHRRPALRRMVSTAADLQREEGQAGKEQRAQTALWAQEYREIFWGREARPTSMPTAVPSSVPTVLGGRHLLPGGPLALIRVHVTDANGLRSALERAPGMDERVEQEVVVGEDIMGIRTPLVVPAGRRVKLLGASVRVRLVAEESGIIDVHSGASITIEGMELSGGFRDRGGAIFNDHGSVSLTNCTLVNNSAVLHGGGVFSSGGELKLENVTMARNEAGEAGGALFIVDDAFASLQSIDFQGNFAPNGADIILGAALLDVGSSSELDRMRWIVWMRYLIWAAFIFVALVCLPWVTVPGALVAKLGEGLRQWGKSRLPEDSCKDKGWMGSMHAPAQHCVEPGDRLRSRGNGGDSVAHQLGGRYRSARLTVLDVEEEEEQESPLPSPRGSTRSFDVVEPVDVVIAAERSAILNADAVEEARPRWWWQGWLADDQGSEEGDQGLGSGQVPGPADGGGMGGERLPDQLPEGEMDSQFLLRHALVDLQHLRLTGSVAHGAHASVFKARFTGDVPASTRRGWNPRRRRWDEGRQGVTALLPRHRPLAVKRLKLEEEPEVVLARWRNEASIWLRISHPNVVALQGVLCEPTLFESPDGLSTFGFGLVMDWHPCSLRDTLVGSGGGDGGGRESTSSASARKRRRRLGESAVQTVDLTPLRLKVARDVARGLAYLHEVGIMHRDVKASNIMLARDGGAQLSDFGEAASAYDDAEFTHIGNHQPIRPIPRGTLLYAPPELLRCEPHDSAVDVWSLGMVVIELMANQPLFDLWKENQATTNPTTATTDSPPQSTLDSTQACGWRPSLEPWDHTVLARLVDRCLAKSPASRPSMRAVLAGIEEELCRLAAQGSAPHPQHYYSSNSSPSTPLTQSRRHPTIQPPQPSTPGLPKCGPSLAPSRARGVASSTPPTRASNIVTRQPFATNKDPPYSGAEKLKPYRGRPQLAPTALEVGSHDSGNTDGDHTVVTGLQPSTARGTGMLPAAPPLSTSPEQRALYKLFHQRWGQHFKTPSNHAVARLANSSTRTNPAVIDQEPLGILPLALDDVEDPINGSMGRAPE